jgi:hypothetical protein
MTNPEEGGMEATKIVERMAYSLCRCEVGMRNMGLDAGYAEIERTWKRFLPEAQNLLEEMYRVGLVVQDAKEQL